ncbi:MAG: DUF6562 domain-containing protein [Muribaculaceae bacterium]
MKKLLLHIITLIAVLVTFTACDVHEVPEAPATTATHVRLSFSTMLSETDVSLLPGRDDAKALRLMRMLIYAYPRLADGTVVHSPAFQMTLTREVNPDDYDCGLTLNLPQGDYSLAVWADFVQERNRSLYYDPYNFEEITLYEPHVANTDLRDAFRGMLDCSVKPRTMVAPPDTIDLHMERPLAKFEFITTDLLEFINEEENRAEGRAEGDPKDAGVKSVDLSAYDIRFYYSGFMPCVYNMFSDKPIDSRTGVWFDSKITPTETGEASLGFDYVMVNGVESFVSIIVCVYDTQGHLMVTSDAIKVPTKRNYHTIVRGKFLTQTANSGVGIDPDFDGEFNIEIKHRHF